MEENMIRVLSFVIGFVIGGVFVASIMKATLKSTIKTWVAEIKQKGVDEYLSTQADSHESVT